MAAFRMVSFLDAAFPASAPARSTEWPEDLKNLTTNRIMAMHARATKAVKRTPMMRTAPPNRSQEVEPAFRKRDMRECIIMMANMRKVWMANVTK